MMMTTTTTVPMMEARIRAIMTITVAILVSVTVAPAAVGAFYLPGTQPVDFHAGDNVDLMVCGGAR